MSLRHLKTEFFRLTVDFKKKKPDMSDKALPHWVKVSKKKFDTIKNAVQKAKRDNLQARPHHAGPINFHNSNKLIQDILNGNIGYEEALNKMADIDNNFAKIIWLESYYPNQIKVENIYYIVSKSFTGEAKELVEKMKLSLFLKNQKVIILMNKKNQTQQDKNLLSNQMNNHTLQICLN